MTAPVPQWRFRPMGPGEINVDPIEGEFFSTEALESLADALVREAVQNSLDARLSQAVPVRVRFTFPRAEEVLCDALARPWLDGLRSHVEAPQSGLAEAPDLGEPLSWLLIEDLFSLSGLQILQILPDPEFGRWLVETQAPQR